MVSTTVVSHTRLLPLYQGFRVKPSGLLSFVRPTGSRTEGRPMRVNDRLRMEFMAECLGKRPAFLMQERPWSPILSINLPHRHSVFSKILASVRRATAIRSSSGLSRFPTLAIGKASHQAPVWFFCAVSSRQWFKRLGVSSRVASESLQARSSQDDCDSFCRYQKPLWRGTGFAEFLCKRRVLSPQQHVILKSNDMKWNFYESLCDKTRRKDKAFQSSYLLMSGGSASSAGAYTSS